MNVTTLNVVIVGAGLRAAIAIAEMNPDLGVALLSKVCPVHRNR